VSSQLSKIGIVITGDNSGAQKAIGNTLTDLLKVSKINVALTAMDLAFTAVSKAIGVFNQVVSLARVGLDAFSASAERMGQLKDVAEQFDLTTSELTAYGRAARMAGSNIEALTLALSKMRSTIGGGKEDPFSRIGLSISKLSQLTAAGQMGSIFDALNKITNPAERQAAGEDIFGKAFKSIDLLSRQGSAGLANAVKEAERLGIVLDAGLLDRMDKADDALSDVYKQFEVIGDTLVSSFAPALEKAAKSVAELVSSLAADGGALDKIASRMEAIVQFSGDYLTNASQIAGQVGGASMGGSSSLIGGLFKAAVGPIGMDGFASVNELGASNERSNKLDNQLKERQLKDKQKADADAAFEKSRKDAISKNLGGLWDGAKGIGAGVGSGAMNLFKGMDELEKWAANFKPEALTASGKGAGALEAGSAAAYAATNAQQQMVSEQKKANDLAKKSETLLGKIAKSVEGWNFVPVSG